MYIHPGPMFRDSQTLVQSIIVNKNKKFRKISYTIFGEKGMAESLKAMGVQFNSWKLGDQSEN